MTNIERPVACNAAAAIIGVGGNGENIGCTSVGCIYGYDMSHPHYTTLFGCVRKGELRGIKSRQKRLYELLLIAKHAPPQCAYATHPLVESHDRIFAAHRHGVIREFRAAQPLDAQILLAVDKLEFRWQALGEELVYHRKSTVVIGVRLLDMGTEYMVVKCRAVGECHHFILDIEHSAP